MIDSTSQVLLSLNKPGNSNDVSSSSRNPNMGDSFSTVYDQSKTATSKNTNNYVTDNDKIQQRNINRRNQIKSDQEAQQASSRVKDRRDGRSLVKETKNDVSSNKSNENNNSRVDSKSRNTDQVKTKNEIAAKKEDKVVKADNNIVKNAEQVDNSDNEISNKFTDELTTNLTEKIKSELDNVLDSELNGKLNGELNGQFNGQFNGEINTNLPVIENELSDELLTSLLVSNTETDKDATVLNEDLTNKAQLAQLAASIAKELEPENENAEESLSALTLSRAEILAGIEKILNKDKLASQGDADKLLKPDAALNANASKVLAEKLSLKELNLTSQNSTQPPSKLDAVGDDLLPSTKTTDALLEKIIERLDFNKVKGELFYQSKIMSEKTSISEFLDQLNTKMSTEVSSGSLLPQVGSLAARTAIVAAAPAQQLTMTTSFNQPEWGADFSKRIQFMVGNDIKNAELRLDPPELGRINIKINMTQDQAAISFTSAHANVRDAIENTLPRLREMLQETGIQLGDANINERQQQDTHQAEQDSNLMAPAFPAGEDDEMDIPDKPVASYSADGLIDYFA